MKITLNSDVLHRAMRAIIPFCSKDESRFHLNGVFFEATADRVTLVATDGHTMAKAEPMRVLGSVPEPGSAILPLDLCKRLLTLCKSTRKLVDEVTVSVENHEVTVTRKSDVLQGRATDSQFPPYGKVIPDLTDDPVTDGIVGLNPAYMTRAGKSCESFAATSTRGVRVQVSGLLDPVRIDCDCPDTGVFVVVLMPMRM